MVVKKILGWENKKIGISLEFCRLGGGWVGGVGFTVRLFACWLGGSGSVGSRWLGSVGWSGSVGVGRGAKIKTYQVIILIGL